MDANSGVGEPEGILSNAPLSIHELCSSKSNIFSCILIPLAGSANYHI